MHYLHCHQCGTASVWPRNLLSRGNCLISGSVTCFQVHHVPAGDSAATASSHKQAAQLEGSQTAQNSKQVADTLTTDPGLPSTKVTRGIHV